MALRPAAIGGVVSALLLTLPAGPASAAGSIRWTPCGDGFQCGTVPVPLSYDHPRGTTITIALTRLPATDPRHRIGSLVINPGGPGLSGIDFARAYLRDLPAELRARFDIVNFDSRGLSGSTALRCYDTAAERFAALAARLRGHPEPGLSYTDFIGTALGAMWTAENWPAFATLLAGVEKGRWSRAAQENYQNLYEGEPGVACSDQVNPRSFRTWQNAADRAERQYGYFGRIYAWVWSQCRSWPASARQDGYRGPWTARTRAPVLIVGNYFDPATPYAGAVGAARLLPNSRLLSYAGWGHVAFHLRHNDCVDRHVIDYLRTGRPPAPGTVCRPDAPFPVPPAGTASR
ncbi:alpha/beta hydrolase [Couchioplanes caeruleus]|uniref:alpha/beta hydrolase n=1 Tax=Couchioplanes caeruleus TaxID=56438 RepID=UPI0020BFFA83|nr:alpha/beta hydrolase [Couchioplanes caeruleus]UQU67781.1 alpha/beta hydrolase [Couchioplanes caeruleus]